ncbi:sugar ABC transporter ATP-binding protein, partial [Escherichia coli]|nr:sugar ABC transporter ATP-binding protein [Escherichia coli]
MNHYHHGLFVNRRRLREVAQAAMTSINVTLP